jgi:hypothetical protein
MAPMTMSRHDADAPGHEGAVAHHATDDHGEDHGHDDHAHDDSMPLGPVDVIAWGAGILGVVLGLAVVWAFYLATSVIPPAG